MNYRFFFIVQALWFCTSLSAQHYKATHGSSYFGSLSVYNNPSSIVNTPYKWDLTVFGAQISTISNAVRGSNFPSYLAPSAVFKAAEGNYARKAHLNYNIRLINARYSIDKNTAFAFGLNFKGYTHALSSKLNYTDSVIGPRSFLFLNEQNRVLHADFQSSAWMELYGTYGFTLWDRESSKLTGGLTVKVLRGMSGIFASASNVGIEQTTEDGRIAYKVANGSARYGYSSNHGNGSSFKASDLFSQSKTSLAFDLGVEYLVKSQAVSSVYDQDDSEPDYEWKIGLSLLDIGSNHFQYGSESRDVSSLKENITNTILQQTFSSITNLEAFNDSLETIVNQAQQLTGNFAIRNPARVVINADRYVSGNFYLNTELSLNIPSGTRTIAVKESSLITLTPRWEKRKIGFYLPVQYTRQGNFWIGGALKAGPLLLGTHNLLNAFSKNKYLSGGAYLALIIRPSNFTKSTDLRSRQYECPTY